MSNKKFGLVPVDKNEIIDVGSVTPQKLPPRDKIDWGNELSKHSGEVLGIAKSVIEGKIDIAKIQAETDAQVRLLNKELDKILLESNAKIEQMKIEGKIWAEKFGERKQLLMEVLDRVEAHPEWTQELKAHLVNVAKEAIMKD